MDGGSGAEGYRQAYSHWLRTGRRIRPYGPDGRELKVNAYHDPSNGQFTFAPGGPRSLTRILLADRGGRRSWVKGTPATHPGMSDQTSRVDPERAEPTAEAKMTNVQLAQSGRGPSMPRGSNYQAQIRPMTIEQAFPGLKSAPGGALVAAADTLFDFGGPARALTTTLTQDISGAIIKDIQSLVAGYRSSGRIPLTLEGQLNELNNLRFDRAVAYHRVRSDTGPLQVETMRFVQRKTDEAYEAGRRLLHLGKLPIRLSREEALGDYINRRVREELRQKFNVVGIDWAGKGPVRVNKLENDTSPSEQAFRRPDFRIDRAAYDVTLTLKTIKTKQVRDFFDTDFKPNTTVIIRPTQLGRGHTYAITKPETSNGF